jgi:uncharacterized RDD family membrane protein YckC
VSSNFNNPYAPALETHSSFGKQFPLATLGKRFVGAMLDGIVSFAIVLPGVIAIGVEAAQQGPNSETPEMGAMGLLGIAWIGLGSLAIIGLQLYLLITRSQTIGKYLISTQIVDYQTGEPAGFLKAFVLRIFVSGLIGAIPFVGWIYSIANILFIFGAERRCLHDLIAGTSVVDISRAS